MTQQTSQEERDKWRNAGRVDNIERVDFVGRLCDDADTLARIREKNLLRSEVPEAPEDAVKWGKDADGTCWWACWPWRKGEVGSSIAFDDAPDYRPDEPGPITLAIVED